MLELVALAVNFPNSTRAFGTFLVRIAAKLAHDVFIKQARYPSDTDTLCELAQQIGLDADVFRSALDAETAQQALLADIDFARSIGGNSFPSLFLQQNGTIQPIPHHFTDAGEVLRAIKAGLAR